MSLSFLSRRANEPSLPGPPSRGDEVRVLHSAAKPVVLRPEYDEAYSFLGEALICSQAENILPGLMFGALIEHAEQSAIDPREIWIV